MLASSADPEQNRLTSCEAEGKTFNISHIDHHSELRAEVNK
jgi:hypothetical protein